MEGKKFDAGKLRWSLIPKGVINSILEILEFGAIKYDADNWKTIPDGRTRCYNSLKRHVDAWWEGDGLVLDVDTNKSHLAHAGCCIFFLIWFELNQKGQ